MSKRQRRANYSQEGNRFLADKYEEYKDIVDAKHKDSNTNKKKKTAWEAIFSQHKTRFDVERALDDLKTRLSKLTPEAKDRLLSAKKDKKVTGGGKPAKEPTPAQQKILDLCEDTPGFIGLAGVESEDVTMPKIRNEQGESSKAINNVEEVLADDTQDSEDIHAEEGNDEEEELPSTLSQSTGPAAKKRKQVQSFDALVEIERANALIKQQNLLLKQQKLKRQIQLLQQQVKNASAEYEDRDPVYFNL